jgi:hypothetical protein
LVQQLLEPAGNLDRFGERGTVERRLLPGLLMTGVQIRIEVKDQEVRIVK